MSIKLSCLNPRELRDWGKAARLLYDISSFGVNVAAIEMYYICEADAV